MGFQEQFHRELASNSVMLSIVGKFRRTGGVLTQSKGFQLISTMDFCSEAFSLQVVRLREES